MHRDKMKGILNMAIVGCALVEFEDLQPLWTEPVAVYSESDFDGSRPRPKHHRVDANPINWSYKTSQPSVTVTKKAMQENKDARTET